MANAKNTKGKDKAPTCPRGIWDHNNERQKQTRNVELALAKAKGQLVTLHLQDKEGDNNNNGYNLDAEGQDLVKYWPYNDKGDYNNYAKPDPAKEDDPRTLRAVCDAQSDLAALSGTNCTFTRPQAPAPLTSLQTSRTLGATPGASGLASTSCAAAVCAAANVAQPHDTSCTPIPCCSVNAPCTANASCTANPSCPIDGPSPSSACLHTNPHPAPVMDQPAKRPGDLPPIVGVNAPWWILFPEKDTNCTIAWIRYGLGVTDWETWLNMQDVAQQVAGLCGFNFTKIWKRQSGNHLALGSRILEKRIPGLQNFEDCWATTWLLQTKFNHQRGHRVQAKRKVEERALALELALDNTNLVEPANVATMDLDNTEPKQPRQKINAELLPCLRQTQLVSTGSYANPQPASQLKRCQEESPDAPICNLVLPPDPLASASFPQPKRACKTKLPPLPEPKLKLKLKPKSEPKPKPKPKPKSKSKPAPKPKAPANTNTEPDIAAPACQRKLPNVDPPTNGSTAKPNGPTDSKPAPAPLRMRSIRPKMRPVPPPTPPPVNATDAVNCHANHPGPNPNVQRPMRRQGLQSSNAALAAMDQTSAAL
ncbi:hypothetical protein RHS04_09260 [Rhizoctonia solani]|uniref:Uncharacterized protein n=1 Tax=Rhizoctonia solani TaxID=456999 RepID=A0A8H7H0J1_9AGAM|nr:hypothetical protein RHS04_09260 [Rhizoctonia solani]